MAEMIFQRQVYGETLIELGKEHGEIIVLDADLSCSTKTKMFAQEFPERFFNFGVAEQNMMATSAGFASCGKIVFASTFAIFAAGRAWDQVRNTICYNNFNVKIVATHAGLTVGEDGASHQAIEDIVLMRSIPNMRVVVPCDGPETRDVIMAAFNTPGPFYIRLGRAKFPTIENKPPFVLGKSYILREGKDVSIFACGMMVEEALKAYDELKKKNISARVVNLHTLRPLDTEMIIRCAKETKGIVVCEEHTTVGGLASAVDEVICENYPTRVSRIGIKGRFGQSGSPERLIKEYNICHEDIIKAVSAFIAR